MKHISIIAKFLLIMAAFGALSLALAIYSGRQISGVDSAYSGLLDHEATASLYLARSNRSLQATRAAIGDLLMSRSADLNRSALKSIDEGRAGYVKFMDLAIAALPANAEILKTKTDGLKIIDAVCGAVIKAERPSKPSAFKTATIAVKRLRRSSLRMS